MENGFVFENGNKADLKKSIQYFINNKNEAAKMGECSLAKIKRYSYDEDCLAIENLLHQLN